jgi:lysine 2,3-aminomutase
MKKEPEGWTILIKNSIKNLEELSSEIELTEDEKIEITKKLPLRITPYYLDLIKKYPVLRKTVVPTLNEFKISPDESIDPLNEDGHNPTNCIVHKYPDRALFLVTNFCSVNCRYCTRSRIFDEQETKTSFVSNKDLTDAFKYIKKHKEIRDVIISGGDPLTLPDNKLEYILNGLRSIKHVEIIRIGTKIPVVLPQRITDNLTNMLKKYHPLYMSIHFTHPDEITTECKEACEKLANAGIPLRSQTVLLKDINDDVDIIKDLMHKLLKIRVSPYYLYNTDNIIGSSHFRCSIDKGIEIIKGLRGFTSGYAIPSYVVDSIEGKIIINPNNIIENNETEIILKAYNGNDVIIKKY